MMWCSVGFAQDKVSVSTLAKSAADTKATGDCNAIWSYKDAEALQTKGAQFLKFNGDLNVSLSEKDAVITKIVINAAQSGTIGKDNKTINIKVGGKSFGSKITLSTKNSKNYSFEGESSGNIVITLGSSTNNASIYIKTVSITYHLASSKTPTTLTFDNPTINIEEGNEATFTGQTATLKTGETELNNAITYTTNNDAMFEAYKANVGPKALKAGAYGTAIVTAKFNGDDTYEASTATYTVNYTEKGKPATSLDFGFTTKTVNIDETFTAAATLKSGETAITGKVTYSSSTPEVAYVDEATGEVMALTAGKAKITATFASTSEYKGSTASYDLTVVDPNATEVTFDFSKPDDYEYEVPGSGSATNLEEGDKIQSGVITITNIKSGKTGDSTNKARFHNKRGNITFRVYANGTISLSAQAGYTITKFTFESAQGGNFTVSSGTYNSATKTWEGNAQSITLTIPNGKDATWFQTMTVTYSKVAAATPLTLEEDADDTVSKIEANNGKTIDVKLTRSLKAGLWNTICLPFDVTAEQVESVLKATGNVKEFDKEDEASATIYFKPATEMKAGVPYLIKPTADALMLEFKGVTINNVDELSRINGNRYCICGVFGKTKLRTTGADLFLNAAGKFVAPAPGKETMKGFRAYFNVPSNTSAAALNINIDGETTGINNIETETTVNGKVYNLNGQYVGNSLNGLKKGIYVVNGKKVIK